MTRVPRRSQLTAPLACETSALTVALSRILCKEATPEDVPLLRAFLSSSALLHLVVLKSLSSDHIQLQWLHDSGVLRNAARVCCLGPLGFVHEGSIAACARIAESSRAGIILALLHLLNAAVLAAPRAQRQTVALVAEFLISDEQRAFTMLRILRLPFDVQCPGPVIKMISLLLSQLHLLQAHAESHAEGDIFPGSALRPYMNTAVQLLPLFAARVTAARGHSNPSAPHAHDEALVCEGVVRQLIAICYHRVCAREMSQLHFTSLTRDVCECASALAEPRGGRWRPGRTDTVDGAQPLRYGAVHERSGMSLLPPVR